MRAALAVGSARPSAAVIATQVIETPAGRQDVVWAERDGAITRCRGGPAAVARQTAEEEER